MADLSTFRRNYIRRAARAVREASPELRGNLRQASPSASGRMAGSIRVDPRGATSVEVSVPVDYASFTRPPGTRPHRIEPRNAKVLAFFWPKVGADVFLPYVNHPGYQPSEDWYGDEIDRWPDLIENALNTIPISGA